MASDNRVVLNPNFSQCSVCLEDFKQPKFLDCFHTFCMECIRDLEKKSPGTVSCPLCQRKNPIPAGGVEQLTSNFYILNLNTNKPEDGLQTVVLDDLQKSKEVFNRKTIYVQDCGTVDGEFDGITFMIVLREINVQKWGNALSVSINIAKPGSPLMESCDINYDISLVNQIDGDYSVSVTGDCTVIHGSWSNWIYLIKSSDASKTEHGFILKETTDVTGKKIKTFQLDVEIKVKSKKMKNFNLI